MIINYEELINCSKRPGFFLSLKDGGWIPATNISTEGTFFVGTDYMNNIPFKLAFEDLGGYLYLDSENPETTTQYIGFKQNFKLLRESLKTEDIPFINSYLYHNLSNEQKVLCASLNKNWEEITLLELKEFWKNKINQYCIKFEQYIDNELNETKENDSFIEELISIKNLIKNIKKMEEIEEFKTIESLCSFWPVLLMPAPGFVTIPV